MIRSLALTIALVAASSASAQDVRNNGTPHIPPPLIEPCDAIAEGDVDFLRGRWAVARSSGGLAIAVATTELSAGSCELNERWSDVGRGTSLMYRRHDRHWHGYWIDPEGALVSLTGGRVGKALVLTGHRFGSPEGLNVMVRVTYTPMNATYVPRVRQHAEQSTDKGVTWSTVSDLLYTRIG